MSSVNWPGSSQALPAVYATLYLLSASLLAVLVQRRIPAFKNWGKISAVRIILILMLGASWLFIVACGVLILGVSALNSQTCSLAIWWCIVLYSGTKVLLYVFLIERVHLIASKDHGGSVSRIKSPEYRVCAVFLALWLAVAIAMGVGRISYIRADGICVIGLKRYATIPMLTLDFVVNIVLTSSFAIPISRSRFPRAQRLARRSILAALTSLLISFANIIILTVMGGHQLSIVCLGSCGIDIILNAVMLFLVTCGDKEEALALSISRSPSSSLGSPSASRVKTQNVFPGRPARPYPVGLLKGDELDATEENGREEKLPEVGFVGVRVDSKVEVEVETISTEDEADLKAAKEKLSVEEIFY